MSKLPIFERRESQAKTRVVFQAKCFPLNWAPGKYIVMIMKLCLHESQAFFHSAMLAGPLPLTSPLPSLVTSLPSLLITASIGMPETPKCDLRVLTASEPNSTAHQSPCDSFM